MRIAVTGATGFVGRALCSALRERGHEVLAFSRSSGSFVWDPVSGPPPLKYFENVHAVISLAGEPVAGGRWTAGRKKAIYDSRVLGTRHLVSTLEKIPASQRPKVFVSASAIGFYGSRGDELVDEAALPGSDFLSKVCQDWEAEALKAEAFGVRVAIPRIGLVLGNGGGAFAPMLKAFRLGLGGKMGDGAQWMSWIHLQDLVSLLVFLMETPTAKGLFNAVSPVPGQNKDFTRTLAAAIHRPAFFHAPAVVLKAALGEMAEALLLGSQRVSSAKIQKAGYSFHFPDLPACLHDLVD